MRAILKLKPLAQSMALLCAAAPLTAPYAADEQMIAQVEMKPGASEAASQGADNDKPGQKLEVITVTGDKAKGFKTSLVQVGAFRDANILDVPLTINVMPRALLDSQGAQGLFDALKNSAGVTRSQMAGTVADSLSIRGIDVNNRTSYRLNGGLPINNLIDLPLENKERIEALKGSAALYYGFTSPAGVVNMVTKRAKVDPITTVSYSGNEFGQGLVATDIGRQFGDNNQYGVRVNLVGGKLRGPLNGYRGDRSLTAFSGDWRASDSLVFKLDFERIHKNAVEQAALGVLPSVNGVVPLPSVPDPTKLLSGTWAVWFGRAQNEALRTDYQFNDNWAATVEAGRGVTWRDSRASTSVRNYNVVTGAGTLQSQVTRGQRYANTNYRFELAGRFNLLLDNEVIVGFMKNKRYQNAPSQQTINSPQNIYNPVVIAEPAFTLVPIYNVSDVRDNGLYALDRIRFTEQVQVLVGARKTDYRNESLATTVITRTTVTNTTPSYGIIYKPRKDTSIYATYIQGLEEGATALPTAANAFEILKPGLSTQNELGVRTEAIPGINANVAYFTIERAFAYTNAANFLVLDGRTQYKGVEYSVTGEITPELSVYISGLFLNAKQKNAANATLINKTPENTPKQAHSVYAEYSPRFVPGFSINAGAYYVARRPVNPANEGYLPSYAIYTVGARYSAHLLDRAVSFQVNVDNAANKRYFSGTGNGFIGVGSARTVKFNAKVDL